jgi:hypothetical protein
MTNKLPVWNVGLKQPSPISTGMSNFFVQQLWLGRATPILNFRRRSDKTENINTGLTIQVDGFQREIKTPTKSKGEFDKNKIALQVKRHSVVVKVRRQEGEAVSSTEGKTGTGEQPMSLISKSPCVPSPAESVKNYSTTGQFNRFKRERLYISTDFTTSFCSFNI